MARKEAVEMTPVEVERYKLPGRAGGGEGTLVFDKLHLRNLSVVIGACVVPPRRVPLKPKQLAAVHIEVEVDTEMVLAAPLLDVIGFPSEQSIWRTCLDPVVLTPREAGVEVVVALRSRERMATMRFKGWEVWIFVAR